MSEQADAETRKLAAQLDRWERGQDGANETDHWANRLARAVLASDWLAAREAAAEVRGAQAALLEAADALNVEAVGFKPEGWGSNDADRQTIDVLRQAVDWLRARAAAAAAGGGGEA